MTPPIKTRLSHLLPAGVRSSLRRVSAALLPGRRSYAQCGEDLILDFAFQWLGVEKPTFLDIGAHHPTALSNTALFYHRGSSGVNVEPNVQLFRAFQAQRTRDVNLNIGISDAAGSLDFFVMSAPELSTFSREEAERVERSGGPWIVDVRSVRVDTVSSVLDAHFPQRPPDLMSLDVEGLDLRILRALDVGRHAPLAICVETIQYQPDGPLEKSDDIPALLRDAGYFVFADTWVNTIFFHRGRFEALRRCGRDVDSGRAGQDGTR